jgi:hypothetical protein
MGLPVCEVLLRNAAHQRVICKHKYTKPSQHKYTGSSRGYLTSFACLLSMHVVQAIATQ